MRARRLNRGHWAKFLAPALAVITVAVVCAVLQRPVSGAPQSTGAAPQTAELLTRGTVSTIRALPLGSGAVQQPEVDDQDSAGDSVKGNASAIQGVAAMPTVRHSNRPIPSKELARRGARSNASKAPFPPTEPVVPTDFIVPFQGVGFYGFNGLSHIDQREANQGNQFSIEPPDQGLCAGNGYVIETVNNVIQVYDTQGHTLAGVEDMNTFFGLAPAIVRGATTSVIGPFLSDPRCYYDRPTQRWFVTELMEDNGNNPGATGRNFNLIAVSQTNHPTGAFTVFRYDVTDDGIDGTPNHAPCPCFGDQPLLGADHFGVYQSTNEFSDTVFNGAQVYAISKAGLIAAADSPTAPLPLVVHFDASQQLLPFGGLSYSIQPAVWTQEDLAQEQSINDDGVEYFLSALQFVDTFDDRIAVWAISNTQSLGSNHPALKLSFNVLGSETYGQPNPAAQRSGDIPLGNSVGEGLEQLNTNDDRMNQVTFADGVLYGGVNSLLSVGGEDHQGIAWFGVAPRFDGPHLKGQIVSQGYVAVAGNDVLFPSLGVNDDGNGVIAFSLSGAHFFPSAAYVDFVGGWALPFVHIAASGMDSEDGFSGYAFFSSPTPGIARWGDYSAAVVDGDHIWFAAEYIPKKCPTNALPCRTANANWGTFVSTVNF
jgi:hypothetical protein